MKKTIILFVALVASVAAYAKPNLHGCYKQSEYGKHPGKLPAILLGTDEVTKADINALTFSPEKTREIYLGFYQEKYKDVNSINAFNERVNSWTLAPAKGDQWFKDNYMVAGYDKDGAVQLYRRYPYPGERFYYGPKGNIEASDRCGNLVVYCPLVKPAPYIARPQLQRDTVYTAEQPQTQPQQQQQQIVIGQGQPQQQMYQPSQQQVMYVAQQQPQIVYVYADGGLNYDALNSQFLFSASIGGGSWLCPDGYYRNRGSMANYLREPANQTIVKNYNYYTNNSINGSYNTNSNNRWYGGQRPGGNPGGGHGGNTGGPYQGPTGGGTNGNPPVGNDPNRGGGQGGRGNINPGYISGYGNGNPNPYQGNPYPTGNPYGNGGPVVGSNRGNIQMSPYTAQRGVIGGAPQNYYRPNTSGVIGGGMPRGFGGGAPRIMSSGFRGGYAGGGHRGGMR